MNYDSQLTISNIPNFVYKLLEEMPFKLDIPLKKNKIKTIIYNDKTKNVNKTILFSNNYI